MLINGFIKQGLGSRVLELVTTIILFLIAVLHKVTTVIYDGTTRVLDSFRSNGRYNTVYRELKNIPANSSLLHVDINSHYLSLYNKANKNSQDNEFTTEGSPLKHQRLLVLSNGLPDLGQVERTVSYTQEEAKRSAMAIYQLAYAYTLNPDHKDSFLLSKGIYLFLMRPFRDLYRTAEVDTIYREYLKLMFSFNTKIAKNNGELAEFSEYRTRSTVIIQRAFRAHQFRKSADNPQPIPESQSAFLTRHVIPELSKTSLQLLPLTHKHKLHWIDFVESDRRDLITKLVTHFVVYRSYNQFKTQLSRVVGQFNEYLHSLPLVDREYLLVVSDDSAQGNHCVSALALPYLYKKPITILKASEVLSYEREHPEVKHLVLFDEVFYSGNQLNQILQQYLCDSKLKKVLIIPFYTMNIKTLDYYKLIKFTGECMLRPIDLLWGNEWTSADNKALDSLENEQHPDCDALPVSQKSGYFFEHKKTDVDATFYEDINLNIRPDEFLASGFIPRSY